MPHWTSMHYHQDRILRQQQDRHPQFPRCKRVSLPYPAVAPSSSLSRRRLAESRSGGLPAIDTGMLKLLEESL